MINPKRLLDDLKRLIKGLEDDLRERAGAAPEIADRLQMEYRSAREAGRSGESFEAWREGMLTQAAVAWILTCVFVRFLEDNGLLDEPFISGAGERRASASDRQTRYFQARPTDTDRDYLYDVFHTLARFPAVERLFHGDDREAGPKEGQEAVPGGACKPGPAAANLVWSYGISGDAAGDLIAFWRRIVPETGELVHDFTDMEWNTRFLGDLYQDLSESARKRFALLQTPEFVEEFILDRTLNPAIEDFALSEVRLIDPACGSGHFLLGAFRRLLNRWFKKEPATPERELVQRALDGVFGVDINPYAAAIARFRLLIEALKMSRIRRLREAPAYRINVTAGDSLLHGRRYGELDFGGEAEQLSRHEGIGHAFQAEDHDELSRILDQRYHAVVGNPPYITVRDKAVNQLYRGRYSTCHRQYALAVPFTERFFQLAVKGTAGSGRGAGPERPGYVGMITANSFMKREFGKKLVEEFFPKVDLSHVIDTSGAYIPGHGTPTVILFGRQRRPVAGTVRTVMGIRGEPSTPENAAEGRVWQAIVAQVDQAGSESEWVSVADMPREGFSKHPWSIGGGGAADLRELVEENKSFCLGDIKTDIGFGAVTREDEAYIVTTPVAVRHRIDSTQLLPIVPGDSVRDWTIVEPPTALWPYDRKTLAAIGSQSLQRFLWPYRKQLSTRVAYGLSQFDRGLLWFEYSMFFKDRYRTPLSITFAFVATHNHFVLDRGGKVFNRSAPVIKLPAGATEAEHLALLGLLNSSTACFWMKQVFHNKGSTVDTKGARQTTDAFENFYEFTGTGLQKFPIPAEKPLDLAAELDRLARERHAHLPASLVKGLAPVRQDEEKIQTLGAFASLREETKNQTPGAFASLREQFNYHRLAAEDLLRRMIALQEELDWRCYELYGLIAADANLSLPRVNGPRPPVPLNLGERAFEIVMARQMAEGALKTAWFERHGSKPIAEIPDHWPEDYRQLVERRIAVIQSDRSIGLIERPEYKRRWNREPWEEQEKRALRGWLLGRLEDKRYWPELHLESAGSLAARAETDAEFLKIAQLYVGHPGFDVFSLVAELVAGESVPFLPVLRYNDSGLRKRAVWERTWELQREEDLAQRRQDAEAQEDRDQLHGGSASSRETSLSRSEPIPAPPKYRSADFPGNVYWRLRGPLDVPKERFVSYPHCSAENDASLVIGWAGWDHLQQARALAGCYTGRVEREGWPAERLKPLLAGFAELLPWLKQWHNDLDPVFNERMGDFFETFLRTELRKYGLTQADLENWTPPAAGRRRGRNK